MRTEHLDNQINELETLRSRGELTYMGGEMLSEFNKIKRALTIPVVSNNEVALKAFVEEFVEAWEDGIGGDTDLYRKAKSLYS